MRLILYFWFKVVNSNIVFHHTNVDQTQLIQNEHNEEPTLIKVRTTSLLFPTPPHPQCCLQCGFMCSRWMCFFYRIPHLTLTKVSTCNSLSIIEPSRVCSIVNGLYCRRMHYVLYGELLAITTFVEGVTNDHL